MSHAFRPRIRRELALVAPRRRAGLLRLGAVTALLWGLASAPAAAQPPYQQELIAGFSSFDVGYTSSPDWVDLDGDGDLDVVVGEDFGRLKFFENTGSSATPAFVERTGSANPCANVDAGFRSSPELVDLDGDGDLDAVIGEFYGGLSTFENTGSSSAAAFVALTGTANPFAGIDVGDRNNPTLADLDGDGDLDAVVGSTLGTLRFFANTGSSATPAFAERTGTANPFNGVDVGSRSSPELVDVDGDGDFDGVVGEYYGAHRYFQNTGSSTAPVFVQRFGTANPFALADVGDDSSPELGDLDGDGDLDAVFGQRFGGLIYFRNSGSSTAPAFVAPTGTANPLVGIDVGFFSSPDLVDLDGDSDLDTVVGESNGTLRTFENTGSTAVPAFAELSGGANPLAGIDVGTGSNPALADLDGDGDLEAVVGEVNGALRAFENTGTTTVPAFAELTGGANPFAGIDVGTWSAPALADLDGDGDLDAIVGEGTGGTLRTFANTGSTTAPLFLELTGTANPFAGITVGQLSNPYLADFDGDSDLDLVIGTGSGFLFYYQNTGSSTAPAFVQQTGTASPFIGIALGVRSSPALVDLDGDGDLDAIVGQDGGNLVFFRSLFAGALLFADGFETGDASAWSSTVPP